MKTTNKKATIQSTSTAIEDEQSLSNNNSIITDNKENINKLDDKFLNTMTLDELYDTSFAPKRQIVENFLYSGVYLFVGAPKVGKSFFMAQLGYCVSKGIRLWDYDVKQGTVLYLALEDDYSRIQKRLSKMYGDDSTDKFHFTIKSKNINDGLNNQLKHFIDEHKDTSLIIIDTLQKVREIGGESYSYANDYDVVTRLKKFADENNICILVVHHTRKQLSDDSFDAISGTNGLLGASDGAFIMQKNKRINNSATIDISGRDCPDQRLNVNFNRERCVWELESIENDISEEPPNPLLDKISEYIMKNNNEWCGTASDLLVELEIYDIQPNFFSRQLNVNIERLQNDYSIYLSSKKTNKGRVLTLTYNDN
ncbi:MAG: AAA family ATPase [Lachnospirales bacterium]